MRYEGGCHCGAVRFRFELPDDERDVLDCNCSICAKKGILHVIVPDAAFTLVRGAERLASYRFGTGVAEHMFCTTCGIHAMYRPRSHPDAWDVNVRCLDGVPLSHWRVRAFDGAHWERAAAELQK
ncbi:MAG TPA: GFA family protein [Kofleriaceae bacterium]|nr:GFA family protein [Kofleriaceae bacterium]